MEELHLVFVGSRVMGDGGQLRKILAVELVVALLRPQMKDLVHLPAFHDEVFQGVRLVVGEGEVEEGRAWVVPFFGNHLGLRSLIYFKEANISRTIERYCRNCACCGAVCTTSARRVSACFR